jgi:hypothetical protein
VFFCMCRLSDFLSCFIVIVLMGGMISHKSAHADEPICLKPVDSFVDPGYCAGLSVAYLDILKNMNKTKAVEISNAIQQTRRIHEQCHVTRYKDAFALGQTAFRRMLFYDTTERLNMRLTQCYQLLNEYRKSRPDTDQSE